MQTDAVGLRVMGCLIEKQRTTPDVYPLSVNALRAACNQTTNREPVTSYGEREVDDVLAGLKDVGLVRFVHPSHGGRVTKYRQVLEERLDLSVEELAVLCVMLLRGPQTVNELRARTERLASFSSSDEVESVLAALAARPEPLVVRFERQPGMREPRWMHLLSGEPVDVPVVAASSPPASRGRNDDRLAALEDEVQRLRAEFDAFRASFE